MNCIEKRTFEAQNRKPVKRIRESRYHTNNMKENCKNIETRVLQTLRVVTFEKQSKPRNIPYLIKFDGNYLNAKRRNRKSYIKVWGFSPKNRWNRWFHLHLPKSSS